MGDNLTWVNDRLHDMLNISDKNIAEFLLGLCRKSASPDAFLDKIRDTETIDINDSVKSFANELWHKMPRQMSAGEMRKMENRLEDTIAFIENYQY